ncbi:10444_t:CDS:2 [Funneliformis geosporum]|uniref:10444_t:CDS:1 n=1 Tax=Funneliformis geosporum TaxID=1117311 RepID=A0A9W4T0I5_9GLOM|nr:10444_t:CDS:2 [Funneliformis geosporum]
MLEYCVSKLRIFTSSLEDQDLTSKKGKNHSRRQRQLTVYARGPISTAIN